MNVPYRLKLELVRMACLASAVVSAFLIWVGLFGDTHTAFLPVGLAFLVVVVWLSWVHDGMVAEEVMARMPEPRRVPDDIAARRQLMIDRAKAASRAFDLVVDGAIEFAEDFAHLGRVNEELLAEREHHRELNDRLAQVASLAGAPVAFPDARRRKVDEPTFGPMEAMTAPDNGERVPDFLLMGGRPADA